MMQPSTREKIVCIVMAPMIILFMMFGLATAGIGTLFEFVIDKLDRK